MKRHHNDVQPQPTSSTGSIVVDIQCTQCSAAVRVLDDGFVHCDACDAALFIDTRALFLHQQIPPIFDENKAAGLLRRWLQAKEIPGSPSRQTVALQWWPLWEVEHSGTKTLMLAASSPWVELEKLDLSAGMRLSFDPERTGEMIPPERFASAALKKANAPEGATLRLLHIPIYKIRYQLGGQTWEALMDGVLGRIYADDMPAPQTSYLDYSHAIAFGLTTTVFTVEGYFIDGFWPIFIAYALSGVALYFLFNRFLLEKLAP